MSEETGPNKVIIHKSRGGTEIEIWAGFGPVGNTEKKNWADYEQLLRAVTPEVHAL